MPFYSPSNPENHNFKKMKKKKKKHLEILLFYRCVQMKIVIYGSWDIERNRHFLPFDRPNKLKNQNFEKIKKQNEKKIWRYYHFAIVYHKWHHMIMYADNFFDILCHFFALLHYYQPRKIKFVKNIKNSWTCLSFYICVP